MISVPAKIRNGILSLPGNFRIKGAMFLDRAMGRMTPLAYRSPDAKEGIDPTVVGYDGKLYQGVASFQYMTSAMAYAASATVQLTGGLPRNTFITEIMLVADPFDTQGDGTNTATIVEDAQDKLLQGLSIAGGPSYYSHSDSVLFGKALGNLNKYVYGGALTRQDISTTSSTTTNSSRESWRLHFGALNDLNPYDITAGIPAELETSLNLAIQFPSTSLLAATSTHKVLQTSTNVYVVVVGVNQLPQSYLQNVPIPDFRTDLVSSPTTTTTINILGSRFLKRSTIISQATSASNNNARNDSNMTDFSINLLRPTTTKLGDRTRWMVAKAVYGAWGGRWPSVDTNGAVAVSANGLVGVIVVDWRKITGNPYGIDTFALQSGDLAYVFTVGTTTGQVSALHEYYVPRNADSLAAMRAWQGKFAFQAA